jgi:hypothetical protein
MAYFIITFSEVTKPMNSVAALLAWNGDPTMNRTITALQDCPLISALAAAVPPGVAPPPLKTIVPVSGFWPGRALLDVLQWFAGSGAEALLLCTGPGVPVIDTCGLRRMTACLRDTDAAIVYGDYFEEQADGSLLLRALTDYQPGSIRDTFNFGPLMLLSGRHLGAIARAADDTDELSFGALYDLRLRLSEAGPVIRLPEPVYRCAAEAPADRHGAHFAYVDPRNRTYQIEMEKIATAHLKRIGAFINPPKAAPLAGDDDFPVEASVIIPVKNRARTIGDAVRSALSQKASFPYNVIVIDNHSTDGTTAILDDIALNDPRLIHLVPQRIDLLIGGCWNEAIYSKHCGRYAVQLDSDDLYNGTDVLTRIVAEFSKHPCALVIGSYTTVNFNLEPLPPGLIDHREWTDDNGMNNALRIAGLGAPRAYHVPTLRAFGFPNVSYGEDYAAVLRLSRTYSVGRIYESLYWCRRWDENSDSKLSPETANRYDVFKDRLRSIELAARIRRESCT